MQKLGEQVRERRRSLGLTLADVAERSGVTRGYLSMIENHRVDNPPSAKVLAKLGAALELDPGDLERSAQWERTPPAIRARLAEAEERAKRGRELAQWLRQVSGKRQRGTGKDLDALYRSGQLGRRVNTVLVEGSSGEDRGSGGEAVAADGAANDATQSGVDQTSVNSRRVTRGGAGGSGFGAAGDEDPRSETAGFGGGGGGGIGVNAGAGADALHFPRPETRDPKPESVPLINKVAAGYPAGFTDLDYPARVGDGLVVVPGYTGLHGGNDPDAFAATVCGASMQPGYAEGDIVVFSPLADVVDGSDCFVRLEPDHEATFKRVFVDEAAGTIRLQPLNPKYEPRTVGREQVAGMFRAVWRMSRL